MKNKKVALVTGASSGIGKEVAIELAKSDYQLVLVARREDKLDALSDKLYKQFNTSTFVVAGDLKDSQFIEKVVADTLNHYGQIDVLVNSSGYGSFKRATEYTYGEMTDIFQINTLAMMYLSELVAIQMLDQQSGHILFLSSSAGKMATVSSSVYSATKFAIIGYANALRLELKPSNIKVTTVNPGPVKTAFFDHDKSSKQYFDRIKSMALDVTDLAKDISRSIVDEKNFKREINSPKILHVASVLYTLFPNIGDHLALNFFNFKEDSK